MARIMPYRYCTHVTLAAGLLMAGATASAADVQLSLIGAPAEGSVHAELIALPADDWDGEPLMRLQSDSDPYFADVAPGRYAVRLFIDRNGNGELDTSKRGIPREPVGFSGNPQLADGMPAPEAAAFEHGESSTLLLIRLRQDRRSEP